MLTKYIKEEVKNILLIPSWLPGEGILKVNGIFSIHQAEIINRLSRRYRPIILDWGQGREYVPLSRPWELRRWTKARRLLGDARFDHMNGVMRVCMRPPIMWSHQLPLGGHQKLVPRVIAVLEDILYQKGIELNLIHAHVSYPGGFLASKISERLRIPYVLTEFMGPFPFHHFKRSQSVYNKCIADPIRGASANLVLSEYLLKQYNLLGLPKPQVVPFSVDGSRFKLSGEHGDASGMSPIRNKETKLIFVGSIIREKGVGDLLQAIRLVRDTGRRVKLEIVGGGKEISYFKKLSDELSIQDIVEWKGLVDNQDLPEMMQAADLFVMPSWHDTFGVVYIEAMACGLPIVATRCGGPDSFITDEIGKLVPIKSPAKLAVAIGEVVDNISGYHRKDIRRAFEANFSDQSVVEKLELVYDQVLKKQT